MTTSGQVLSFLGFGSYYFALASRLENKILLGSVAMMGLALSVIGLFVGLAGLIRSFSWRDLVLLLLLQGCFLLIFSVTFYV